MLEEEKTAVINRAVTKGLDPDVPMRESGIPWLGKIPAHWKIEKLKNLSSVKLSGVDKKSKDGEIEIKLCNYVDVYNNEIISEDLNFMTATASINEINNLELKSGDVIITKDSESWDDIAVPAYVPITLKGVVCGYHLALIRSLKELLCGEYLYWLFKAHQIADQFQMSARGITRYGLTQMDIKNALIPIPPKKEQEEILSHLSSTLNTIQQKILAYESQINLLLEYRTALINEAVTGKIDVRGEEGNRL